jgi:hypothetical protein
MEEEKRKKYIACIHALFVAAMKRHARCANACNTTLPHHLCEEEEAEEEEEEAIVSIEIW